jgi:hypothetical protein
MAVAATTTISPRSRKRTGLAVRLAGIVATAALALGACGDDSDGSSDSAAFCAAGLEIQEATAAISSPESAVAVFSSLSGTIDDLVDVAPDDVAADATAFADHVRSAVESGDFTAFEDGTVDEITGRLDAACQD